MRVQVLSARTHQVVLDEKFEFETALTSEQMVKMTGESLFTTQFNERVMRDGRLAGKIGQAGYRLNVQLYPEQS
jgi:hypothetical protein